MTNNTMIHTPTNTEVNNIYFVKPYNHCHNSPINNGSNHTAPTSCYCRGVMKERKNRDPSRTYEVIEVLRKGSMGSVIKVKKRPTQQSICNWSTNMRPWKIISRIRYKAPSACANARNESRTNYSTVYRENDDEEICFALKWVSFFDITLISELRNEIKMLKSLNHPNIATIMETYDYKKRLYVVMELCSGGDLYTRDPYTEQDALKIVKQILSAVAYMHRLNIIHRDLKYENILFKNDSPDADIKIIDFGLSAKSMQKDAAAIDNHIGAIYSMAPQVFEGLYDLKDDVWAIGVITFMLLSGQFPFFGKNRSIVIDKILQCDFNFHNERWVKVSNAAVGFVSCLLEHSPQKRPTALQAMHHPFLTSFECIWTGDSN